MGKTYIGVGDTAQQSKKIYLGVNDVAKKVKKAYVGVNGVAQQVYSSDMPAFLLGGEHYIDGIDEYFIQYMENEDLSDSCTCGDYICTPKKITTGEYNITHGVTFNDKYYFACKHYNSSTENNEFGIISVSKSSDCTNFDNYTFKAVMLDTRSCSPLSMVTDGNIMLVSFKYSTDAYVSYSKDGDTWKTVLTGKSATTSTVENFARLRYFNGTFYCLMANGLYKSTDGINWESFTITLDGNTVQTATCQISGYRRYIVDILYHNNVWYMATAPNSVTTSATTLSTGISTGEDLDNMTTIYTPAYISGGLQAEYFEAFGGSFSICNKVIWFGAHYYSIDGTTWTPNVPDFDKFNDWGFSTGSSTRGLTFIINDELIHVSNLTNGTSHPLWSVHQYSTESQTWERGHSITSVLYI